MGMVSDGDVESAFMSSASGLSRRIAENLPEALIAVFVMFVGWVIARSIRHAVRSGGEAANRFLRRRLTQPLSPLLITIVSEALFWATLVVAAIWALRIVGLDEFARWIDRVAVYLPNLFVALAVLVGGYLLSAYLRDKLTEDGAGSARVSRWSWLAPSAQVLILSIALIVALDQLGIDVGLLIALAIVAAAGVALALGATFALGAREHTANLVGMRAARAHINAHDWVQFDDVDGEVVEIAAAYLILENEGVRCIVPGRYFDVKVARVSLHKDNQEAPSA